MDISLYLLFHLIVSVITLFIGYRLIAGLMPEGLKGTTYETSRKLMGVALSISPTIFILYYFTGLRGLPEHYTTAMNLMGYYPTSALINISLLILIGEKIDLRSKIFKIYLLSFLIFPVYILFGIAHVGIECTLTSANTLLFASIAGQFIYFFFKYKNVDQRADQEHAYEIKIHIKWIREILYMMISLAIIATSASIYLPFPLWARALCSFYVLLIYIHIYESYYRFIIAYHIRGLEIERAKRVNHNVMVQDAKSEEPSTKFNFNSPVFQQIESGLVKWIDSHGYNKRGVTIELVAEELHTNRTYLSAYINSVYKSSFKIWLTKLRIEHAKLLLADTNLNYTLNEIANKIGFSSQSSFIHVFSKTVGMTPSKWREENHQQPI